MPTNAKKNMEGSLAEELLWVFCRLLTCLPNKESKEEGPGVVDGSILASVPKQCFVLTGVHPSIL